MRHKIPAANWPTHLADAIEVADDGDVIVCHSGSMKSLAERAHGRMCPDKLLSFPVEPLELDPHVEAFEAAMGDIDLVEPTEA